MTLQISPETAINYVKDLHYSGNYIMHVYTSAAYIF
jgi:hypothetical protein